MRVDASCRSPSPGYCGLCATAVYPVLVRIPRQMQLNMSGPVQSGELLNSRKRSSFIKPTFPNKLPRVERVMEGVEPMGLPQATTLSSTFQKEVLFFDVPGELIDQVLQEHHVELRPTTLSEERHLMQLQKRACSSKQRRLLSLKQLPDIYPDILNLFYFTCVKERLGSMSPDEQKTHVSGKLSVGPVL
ncbi:uncharacterized protein C15orf39 homolog [Arapaima gigas]